MNKALAAFVGLLISAGVTAHDFRAGALQLIDPHLTAPPPGAETASASLTIVNTGNAEDTLLSAETPAAGTVELHHMTMDGGLMRMRALTQGLPLPSGTTLDLAASGDHLMLVGLKKSPKPGESLPMTLHFARAGAVAIEVRVDTPGAVGHEGMNMPMH